MMMAGQVIQHHDWVGTFLTAVVIPLAFGGATLAVFWLDARNKIKERRGN
jgi:hypothetical protein